jgi:hypothetical protein
MIDRTAPSATEIEVSVFGRRFGESVLIHLGDAQWILIDSLVDNDGVPSPLRYLSEIGVDPRVALRLIVATHWHDDHIEGLSEIYRQAPNAVFAMPQAMTFSEVQAFIAQARVGGSEKISSGVQELDKIATFQRGEARGPFRLAKTNTVLLRIPGLSHGHPVSVEALSPNDKDVQAFVSSLAGAPPIRPGRRIMPFEQNDVSVALWISVAPLYLLVGADLENSSDEQRGWHAVLHSPAPLAGRASFIKIPHHGSQNGHHQPVWDNLLVEDPFAALTTWNRGSKLPSISDVRRILSLTSHAFVTSSFVRNAPRHPSAVERTLREAGISIKASQPFAGQVRLRHELSKGANWTVELFNDATNLEKILTLLN